MSEKLTKEDVDFLQEASTHEDIVAARELAIEASGMDENHQVTVHYEDGKQETIAVHAIGRKAAGTEVQVDLPNSLTDTWRSTAEK